MRNLVSCQPWASIFLVVLSIGHAAQALSVVDNMTGRYARLVFAEGRPAVDDTELPQNGRQEIVIRRVTPGMASVSFFIGSHEGSRPSCSGEDLKFVAVPESQSLVYPLDQAGCTMKLSIVQGGGLKFESTAVCSVELCGAGIDLNQDGDSTIFTKK
jgi:hypothetical protein